jgi:hypothetical protein
LRYFHSCIHHDPADLQKKKKKKKTEDYEDSAAAGGSKGGDYQYMPRLPKTRHVPASVLLVPRAF